ncbi:MAG: anion transporter [Chloroflexi bacterium]|nr:anion transporter [Chloroflexota bacterium]
MAAAALIFALTYLGIAFNRVPKVNIDRPTAALIGATLMVLAGVLTFDEAVAAVNFDTIALLLGMMMLVVVLQQAGFFTLLAVKTVSATGSPIKLMAVVIVATAVFSAFLVNDVIVLLFTPVIIQACRMNRLNPIPYLIAEAMASNIGSSATIIGNPQNVLIGITSEISFGRFFLHLLPVAFVSTLILMGVIWLFYRNQLTAKDGGSSLQETATKAIPIDRQKLLRMTPIVIGVIVTFFLHSFLDLRLAVIALSAGGVAVVVSGIKPSNIIKDVDWVLLLFFAGLFIVVHGAQDAGVLDFFLDRVSLDANTAGVVSIHGISTVVSQIVSNVPFTLLVIPLLQDSNSNLLWLSLASGATLGGNMTLIGAVANLIVAEVAYRDGVTLKFGEFFKVGAVVTVLTLIASVGILLLQYELGWLK